MPENKDTPTNVPRTKAGEHAVEDMPDDKTPPTGPQSGPLSPFGGNPSPALDVYVKGMEDEVHLHPPIDPTPPDPGAPIDQAQREIRAFTFLLHPQNLLTDGLKITIEQFVNGFSARTSLKTSLEIAPDVDKLSYERQRAVLRVIQEALMNVFRHARATRVNVTMETMDRHFKLQIADNGRGMSINQARSGPKAIAFGVGIPAMKARLRQLGGTLEIHSSSATGGRGTTLCAELPHSLPLKTERQRVRHHKHLGHHRSIAGQR